MKRGQQNTARLYTKGASVDFYQKRYRKGYMDEWPKDKKRKLIEVIRSLKFPESGEALDYGCGNGVLTEVFKQTLPGWDVYGTDISAVAIENAKKTYPDCTFFVSGDKMYASKKFSLLITHHVLEHVYDLQQAFKEITAYTSNASAMLHILPCGNEGSFEHGMCQLRKDGINTELEGRFYYEDEGHLRRLNTEQMQEICGHWGFHLEKEFYNNHFFGAINNLTRFGPKFIWMFSDSSLAINKSSKQKLQKIRFLLGGISLVLYPLVIVERKMSKKNRSIRDNVILAIGLPYYMLIKPFDIFLKRKAYAEWSVKKTERNGSEMLLFFTKDNDCALQNSSHFKS